MTGRQGSLLLLGLLVPSGTVCAGESQPSTIFLLEARITVSGDHRELHGPNGEGWSARFGYRQDGFYSVLPVAGAGPQWGLAPPEMARIMAAQRVPPKKEGFAEFPPPLKEITGGGTQMTSCDHKLRSFPLENPHSSGQDRMLSLQPCGEDAVALWYAPDRGRLDDLQDCIGKRPNLPAMPWEVHREESKARGETACPGSKRGSGLFVGRATWSELAEGKTFPASYRKHSSSGDRQEDDSIQIDLWVQADLGARLKAVPGGPYSVTRGGKVHLDGSGSKGPVKRWVWTLSAGEGCPAGVPGKTLEGKTVDLTVLCPLRVALMVEDGAEHDTATVAVAVKARDWKTDFPKTNPVAAWTSAPHLRVGCLLGGCSNGRNSCALDGKDETHDIVHQSDVSTYEGDAFVLATVGDPTSPFDGWTWVSENRSRIHRRSLLNPELMPGSVTAARNAGSADYGALVASVRAHEQLHSDLFREGLATHGDPARQMEAKMGPDRERVLTEVNLLFQELSSFFNDRYSEDEPEVHRRLRGRFNRTVHVQLRLGESTTRFGDYDFEGKTLADLGD